jgi:tetratricopeptide (TPR) repeat protein
MTSSNKALVIFVLALLGSKLVYGQDNMKANDWRYQYDRKQYSKAIELLREKIQMYPDSTYLIEYEAITLEQMGQVHLARHVWESLLKNSGNSSLAKYRLASIAYDYGDYWATIDYVESLIQEDTQNVQAYKLLGRAQRQVINPLGEFAAFNKVIRLQPNDLEALSALVDLFLKQQQYREADSLVFVALSYAPDHYKLRQQQLEVCYADRYYEHTASLIQSFEGRYPLNNYLRRMMAAALTQIEAYETAIEYLKSIEEPDSKPDVTHFNYYRAYAGLQNRILARKHLEEAIAACQHPNEGRYRAFFGNLLVDSQLYFQAGQQYEIAASLLKDVNLYFLAARAQDAGEQYTYAIRNYTNYIRSPQENKDPSQVEFANERIAKLKSLNY